jgi:hypothetical protein
MRLKDWQYALADISRESASFSFRKTAPEVYWPQAKVGNFMQWPRLIAAFLLMLVSVSPADVVTLKDETTADGIVFRFGDEYRIKQADGRTTMVKLSDVVYTIKPPSLDSGSPLDDYDIPDGVSPEIVRVMKRARDAKTANESLAMWKDLIAAKPTVGDRVVAEFEARRWQDRVTA